MARTLDELLAERAMHERRIAKLERQDAMFPFTPLHEEEIAVLRAAVIHLDWRIAEKRGAPAE